MPSSSSSTNVPAIGAPVGGHGRARYFGAEVEGRDTWFARHPQAAAR